MPRIQENTLVVLGPTASRKTRLGVELARELRGEIISADSRQVYRGLDIGAGKDLAEYRIDGVAIPYHLIDIADLSQEFSVFDYQQRFYEAFTSLERRGVLPVVVGGTGLYLEAALKGYRMVAVPENVELRAELNLLSHDQLVDLLKSLKEKLHNITDLENRDRMVRAIEIAVYSRDRDPEPALDIRPLIIGTQWDREDLRVRIRVRLLERLEAGMIEEVIGLHDAGVPCDRLERLGLEYRFIADHLQGRIRSKNDLAQKLCIAICQFAKRQETWFRRMERNGFTIHWIPRADFSIAKQLIEKHFLRDKGLQPLVPTVCRGHSLSNGDKLLTNCGHSSREKAPWPSRSKRIQEYLLKRAGLETRPLVSRSRENVHQVVVIPALAEKENLFKTLDSLARNPVADLQRTLVICVVNNRVLHPSADIKNNSETLSILDAAHRTVCRGLTNCGQNPPELVDALERGLRLAYIDASSPGRELSDKSGVGAARKIGLDWGLSILDASHADPGVLLSLDADTWVDPNYLEAARACFSRPNAWAAAFPFAHRLEGSPAEIAAIVCYEIFLRYHVMGLAYACSPYAFHSIGSAMACTADAYVAVSGMNQRQAGEDFYFLQQLAKTGRVDAIRGTTVYPSPRPSHRVPFGTGQRVRRFIDASQEEYLLYDPRCYAVLKAWLSHVSQHLHDTVCLRSTNCGADSLRSHAADISPALARFLDEQEFMAVWPRLQHNARDSSRLHDQFHRWFDGFKTLKLIHYLRERELPMCDMFEAVTALLKWTSRSVPDVPQSNMRENTTLQIALLNYLRACESQPNPL